MCQNLGRQAYSSHFWRFEIGQSPIFGGVARVVPFLDRLCKLSDIFWGWGMAVDTVRAIFGVIQFLYLNNNMSLIISRNASEAC